VTFGNLTKKMLLSSVERLCHLLLPSFL